MNIQVLDGKVVMLKNFTEDEVFAAQCLNFEINDACNQIIAYIDKTTKEAMLEFLKKSDRALVEGPAQIHRRNLIFGQLKEQYNLSAKRFVAKYEPTKLYDNVGRTLYKHQLETLWKYQNKPVNLCSFEQGLGKTIFAASVSKLFQVPRTIVVGPALVKWNWVKDLCNDWGFNDMFFTVLDSKKCMYSMMHERFVIVNYEVITKFWKHLTMQDCGHIIIDECHYAKNHASGRSKSVQKLIKAFPKARVTLLTGTPVTNRVTDLYAYLKIANHPLGSNFKKFKDNYALGKQKVTGVKNAEDLRLKIANFMVRKKTEECIDLPELRINKWYFDMDDEHVIEYNKYMDDLYNLEQRVNELNHTIEQAKQKKVFLTKEEKKDIQAELRDLRMKKNSSIHTMNRICANAKVPNIIKLAEDMIANGEKVIIFSGYVDTMDDIKAHFGDKSILINGKVSAKKRQTYIDRFIEDPNCNVFIGQFIAAGIGINLVNSTKTIFTNFPFTPDLIEQPMKRSHRGGQTKDVDIFFTIIPDSIDEKIYQIIQSKGDDINKVIDHDKSDKMEYGSIENKLFSSLFKDYEKEKGITTSVVNDDEFQKVK